MSPHLNLTRRTFLLAAGASPLLRGQSLLRREWTAKWIAVPKSPKTEYGVYHFRKTFDLAARPERFLVHTSGDNRYQLFVNAQRVAWGPARGDLFHWRYETVDIAGFLKPGKNLLAAVVWNFGQHAPEAQITLETAFVLQGDGDAERVADTGPTWKCIRNEAYAPVVITSGAVRGYWAAGPGDRINAAANPWGWESPDFDDSAWPSAAVIAPAAGREARDVHTRWMLVPRTIPMMEERIEKSLTVRKGSLANTANSKTTVLFDQGYLTTAYPRLTVSGGKDAVVRMRYAEALFNTSPREKGNRNEIDGKEFIGNYDEFVLDGGTRRVFRPLWWRTWRYLQLEIETRGEPVTIEGITATATGFPFVRKAAFDAGVPELNQILDVGWRTARLCAHETYMDCPYYEQLQYAGDTRIQCLVSLFQTGDARLMRNAIDLLNDSRQSDGCTMSRYPTRLEQYIPGFALWWVGMVHDYHWYVADAPFVRRMLPGVRSVLSFFEAYQKDNGSLSSLPWWRYFDWVQEWPNGDAPQDADGGAALFDLQLLLAYRWAAALEKAAGLPELAQVYSERERLLRATIRTLYWDAGTSALRRHAVETKILAAHQYPGGAGRHRFRRRSARPHAAHPHRARTRARRSLLQVLHASGARQSRRRRSLPRAVGRLARHARQRPHHLRRSRGPSRPSHPLRLPCLECQSEYRADAHCPRCRFFRCGILARRRASPPRSTEVRRRRRASPKRASRSPRGCRRQRHRDLARGRRVPLARHTPRSSRRRESIHRSTSLASRLFSHVGRLRALTNAYETRAGKNLH